MTGHWWRAYDEALDDPKLQRLSADLFRAWFNLMCLASQGGGVLPPMRDIAFKLRINEQRAEKLLAELRRCRLFDEREGTLRPHNWEGRQFKTDVTDPTNASRQHRYRNRKRNAITVTDTVTDKRPDTDTDTDTERKQEDAAQEAAPPGRFVFESGVIRLKRKDFDLWEKSFKNLNLSAELVGLAPWAAQQENWFFAVGSALAKRDRQALRDKSAAALAPNGSLPDDHPDKWREALR